MRNLFTFIIFLLNLLKGNIYAQNNGLARSLHFNSPHTSFPDSGREKGHIYDSVFYSAADHYHDSAVLMIIPGNLHPSKKINLIFWFHGWRNNIDTALEFYQLKKQFLASGVNAVLVLAETAKNAPDSYGGRLEEPGLFHQLVNDVIHQLEINHLVPNHTMPGEIMLAGHSGAFRVIARILQNGQEPVQEVFLFDALYGETDKFMNWINQNPHHHFVHWFTNQGGGTDEVSLTMMQELKEKQISFLLTEEAGIKPETIRNYRILFVHSLREHNVIINNPDNFQILLENSWLKR